MPCIVGIVFVLVVRFVNVRRISGIQRIPEMSGNIERIFTDIRVQGVKQGHVKVSVLPCTNLYDAMNISS